MRKTLEVIIETHLRNCLMILGSSPMNWEATGMVPESMIRKKKRPSNDCLGHQESERLHGDKENRMWACRKSWNLITLRFFLRNQKKWWATNFVSTELMSISIYPFTMASVTVCLMAGRLYMKSMASHFRPAISSWSEKAVIVTRNFRRNLFVFLIKRMRKNLLAMKLRGRNQDGARRESRTRMDFPERFWVSFESCELLQLQRDSGIGTTDFLDGCLGSCQSSTNRTEKRRTVSVSSLFPKEWKTRVEGIFHWFLPLSWHSQ